MKYFSSVLNELTRPSAVPWKKLLNPATNAHFLTAGKLNEWLWYEYFGGWGHNGFKFKNPVNVKQKFQNVPFLFGWFCFVGFSVWFVCFPELMHISMQIMVRLTIIVTWNVTWNCCLKCIEIVRVECIYFFLHEYILTFIYPCIL